MYHFTFSPVTYENSTLDIVFLILATLVGG